MSIKTIGKLYSVDGDLLARQYKRHISGFEDWELRDTAEEYVLFPENIVTHLSIDETCLSYDELYTIVTNKAFKGKKGSLVAMVKGTKAEVVIGVLRKISAGKRSLVKEETLDLSLSMQLIVKRSFPCTIQVSDRFHMQKLLGEALEEIRIKYRWEAIETENERIKLVRSQKRQYIPKTYENGETRRQLLARSKHLLQMHCSKWTDVQQKRGEVLFRLYPDIKECYDRYLELVQIYNLRINDRPTLMTKLARWYDRVYKMKLKCFNTVLQTLMNNYQTILNYFDNRSTNASAESFNAKVKAFRSQFRGVRDIPLFIFRLAKIFAKCRAPQLANTPASSSKHAARATPKGLAPPALCLSCP